MMSKYLQVPSAEEPDIACLVPAPKIASFHGQKDFSMWGLESETCHGHWWLCYRSLSLGKYLK
jgi:hypothetical protein